jgi:peptide deformylase
MEADSALPMRVYKITKPSDSILLRTKSAKVSVDPEDPVLQTFIKRLYRTVRDSLSMGVGIAAPQVGILKRIIWVQRFDKEGFPFEVYLNPEIKQYSTRKQTCLEGCLSIPNRRDTLNTRAYAVLLEYDKIDQSHQIEMVEDFTAVIFQHEIDHLDGILYLDHLEKEVKSQPHN